MLFDNDEGRLTPEDAKRVAACLKQIAAESTHLSLPLTSKLAQRLSAVVATQKIKEIAENIGELESRFHDEVEDRKLFLISPELFRFYDNSTLAGEHFKANFPRANTELIEAGNCLVLDRYTACVFHLMRALDIALMSLQAQLGIPLPDKLTARTWGNTLGRIKTQMDLNNTTPPAGWDKEFHDKAYTFIQAVKTAFRDTTMHVESSYDQASAQSVFNVSIEVLKHLATRLKE